MALRPAMPYKDNPADVLIPPLISVYGMTTAAGAGTGLTLVDAGLIGQPPIRGCLIIIDGASAGQSRDIVAHTLGTGTLTVDSPFTDNTGAVQAIPAGTRYVVSPFPISLTTIIGLLPDRVYLDLDNGAAGTAWPTGTPGQPVNNITDALAIAAARGLAKIEVCGESGWVGPAIALPSDFNYIHLTGQNPMMDVMNLNGHGAYGGLYDKFSLHGTHRADAGIQATGCWLGQVALLTAPAAIDAFKSIVYNLAVSGGACSLNDCIFRGGTVTLSGVTPNCAIWGAKGSFTLAGMTAGTANIYGNGLNLAIAASCVAGTINIYGDVRVTNNSGGAVVNIYPSANQSRPQKGTQATTNVLATVGAELTATAPFKASGLLSLDLMQAGDTFLVTEEIRDQDDATWREYGRNSYTGVQASPMVHFSEKVCQGWRIRIQMTAGVNRDVTYQLFSGG